MYHDRQVTVTAGDDSRLALTMVSTGGRLASLDVNGMHLTRLPRILQVMKLLAIIRKIIISIQYEKFLT